MKQGLRGKYYPQGWRFPMKTPHGLACGKAALTLQRKGKKAWQVKVCLALIFVGNMKDSSRKRSRPTAPWAKAEKRGTLHFLRFEKWDTLLSVYRFYKFYKSAKV